MRREADYVGTRGLLQARVNFMQWPHLNQQLEILDKITPRRNFASLRVRTAAPLGKRLFGFRTAPSVCSDGSGETVELLAAAATISGSSQEKVD